MRAEQNIAEGVGGFGGALDNGDHFGHAIALVGDLDGDGIPELAVGAPFDDDGALDQGALWILFMNADGTVRSETKISETAGGFGGNIGAIEFFGMSLAPLGDLDGDGIPDLAVSHPKDDDRGAIWLLFLDTDGTVKSERKIASSGLIDDWFGISVANIGDLDSDGVLDLAVGANGIDDGGSRHGGIWILFLDGDGAVRSRQKISETTGGGLGELSDLGYFGYSVTALGDVDDDGTGDIAVGEIYDDDGGNGQGAVWVLFLEPDGRMRSAQKISETNGGFTGVLGPNDYFGSAVASLGDLNGDGISELAVGSRSNGQQGTVWILFLDTDGTVKATKSITEGVGGFEGPLDLYDYFGTGVANVGDLDGDGNTDLAAGAYNDNGGPGMLWVLFLAGPEACVTLDFETEDDLVTPLVNGQHLDVEFGALATLSSSGPNAGLAIFDSTVGGPNDPSQDLDLLVDSGNVLILQTENFAPDTDDVFPHPNDDEDGGTMSFAFERAVSPRSLRLIDIDAGDRTCTVALIDSSGARRTFTVPSNWTGDLLLAQPGQGTLDLTLLTPQVGFGSSATASEQAGFDASDVVRIDVALNGSGAIDDLAVCIPDAPRASAAARNGSGRNPWNLAADSVPVIGSPWAVDLDCTTYGSGLATLVMRRSIDPGSPSIFGEQLVRGALLDRTIRVQAGAVTRLSWNIPYDLSLLGLELHAQGLCRGDPSAGGPKLIHVRAALSNALDVRLGF